MGIRKSSPSLLSLDFTVLCISYYNHTYMIQKYVKERERFHSVVKTILELTV